MRDSLVKVKYAIWGSFRSSRPGVKAIVVLGLLVASCVIVLSPFLTRWSVFSVHSISMTPTLQPGDRCLIDLFSYKKGAPLPGDIVVFQAPPPSNKVLVKRVIASPGDLLEIHGGNVYINHMQAREPYLLSAGETNPLGGDAFELTMPEGCYFLMGDNRLNSEDSRQFGPVPFENLHGKVTAISFSRYLSRIGRCPK
jgi:signal peptidase I